VIAQTPRIDPAQKPPFGLKAHAVPLITGLASEVDVSPTVAVQPVPAASWWHEAGKSMLAAGIVTFGFCGLLELFRWRLQRHQCGRASREPSC
jgi:hypothetical protein